MFQTRKLKPDRSINGLIIPLASLPIFVLSMMFFGPSAGFIFLGALYAGYAIYSLFIVIRMGNVWHIFVSLFQAFAALICFLFPDFILHGRFREWQFGWALGVVPFGIFVFYLVATRKIKWRGREIFELAAASVEETGNGYTPRPRPVGKVEFSKQELLAFARFCARNLIAVTYINPRQVTIAPVMMGKEFGYLFGLGSSYQEATWISFDFDGEVVVHIAHKDYLDYQEPLAFDPLCQALGELFIEFARLHQRGEGVRIIDRLDALKLGYFS